MSSSEPVEEYCARWFGTVERQLSDAVDAALQERSPDPLRRVAALLEERCDRQRQTLHEHCQHLAAAACTTASAEDAPKSEQSWDTARWLASGAGAPIADAVTAALLRPFHGSGELSPPPSGVQQRTYLRSLAKQETSVAMVEALLRDSPLLTEISRAVCGCAIKLNAASVSDPAKVLSDKFAASTFTLSFGDLGSFFSGLEGLVGAPSPMLHEVMLNALPTLEPEPELEPNPTRGPSSGDAPRALQRP